MPRAEYANVDRLVAVVVMRRLATLHELQTVYDYEDVLDMIEMISVADYNEAVYMEEHKRHGY